MFFVDAQFCARSFLFSLGVYLVDWLLCGSLAEGSGAAELMEGDGMDLWSLRA
jgi:hypothetical protein